MLVEPEADEYLRSQNDSFWRETADNRAPRNERPFRTERSSSAWPLRPARQPSMSAAPTLRRAGIDAGSRAEAEIARLTCAQWLLHIGSMLLFVKNWVNAKSWVSHAGHGRGTRDLAVRR